MNIFTDKWQYFGLFISPQTKFKLFNFLDTLPYKKEVSLIKDKSISIYIDHCTLFHRSKLYSEEGKDFAIYLQNLYNSSINKEFPITLTHIGLSDKSSAFKVSLGDNIKSFNKTPHVTIGIFIGGKPVDSNSISNWLPLPTPITINTTLKFI